VQFSNGTTRNLKKGTLTRRKNSLWTLTFLLIGLALSRLVPRFRGPAQLATATAAAGIACYVVVMGTIDVPMYFGRWQVQCDDTAKPRHRLDGFAPGA